MRLLAPLFLIGLFLAAPLTAQTTMDSRGAPIYDAGKAVTGNLSNPGTDGKSVVLRGPFNVAVVADVGVTQANLTLERSFDQGATWFGIRQISLQVYSGGATVWCDGWASCGGQRKWSSIFTEPESGVLYRVSVDTLVGTGGITYRLSQ